MAPARPQTGLTGADVVYVEPVEGGLSRILAVFSSRLPEVGPVRSARESDLDLLRQYGPAGFVFSGANRGVLASVKESDLVRLSPDQASFAYARRGPHSAPHNLYVDLAELAAKKGRGVATAHDVGFRFGAAPAGGTPLERSVVRYGAATTAFTWSAAKKRWNVSLDGKPASTTDGGRLGPATVVIQDTEISDSTYHDVLGNPTPFTRTVGSGTATVLRDGRSFDARWSRPTAAGGTTWTTRDGAPLPFAPGQVWIVFRKG